MHRSESASSQNSRFRSTYKLRRRAVATIRTLLYASGALRRIAQRRARGAILMFHNVESGTSSQFHDLLRFLSRNFEIVSLATLLNESNRGGVHRFMRIALTFDDGLRNQHTVAYPILSDLQLPATFYVCPGLIGQTVTTWTWEMWCRIPWLGQADCRDLFGALPESWDVARAVNWMKGMPLAKRISLEAEIRSRTSDFAFTEAERGRYELMDWNDLAEMNPSLISIGSHSLTHADLPQVEPHVLADELSRSRTLLEGRLGRPALDFAYPNGNHNDAVVRATALVYRSAVTTTCGGVGPADSPYRLKRIGASVDQKSTCWLLAMHTGRAHGC
jgi:peptidoglycan/xylan/chitin deacetylase (PgdA/CDA1 family)